MSCCVIVLPPWTTSPAPRFRTDRAKDAFQIDARMLIEMPVLAGQHRIDQLTREILAFGVRPLNRSLAHQWLAIGGFEHHHRLEGAVRDFVPRHIAQSPGKDDHQ